MVTITQDAVDPASSQTLEDTGLKGILEVREACKGVVGGLNGAAARLDPKRMMLNFKM